MSPFPPNPSRLGPRNRGQSEVLGMLLMVALVAITVTLIGGVALQSFNAQANAEGPIADIGIEASASNVTITHGGGETLDEERVAVIIRSDESDLRYALDADPIDRTGTDDGSFQPGETATFSNPLSGGGEILVVATDESAVIARSSWSKDGAGGGQPVFSVEIDNTNSPVSAGEPLEVRATIENIGGDAGTQTIDLSVPGDTVQDNRTVSLAAGEWTQVTLTWDTQSGDEGSYPAIVESENDSDSASVSVQSPAVFNVTIDGTNSPVTEGEIARVNATITNTGEDVATQSIELDVEGQSNPVDTQDVGLDGGEARTITLEWQTNSSHGGNGATTESYNVTVESLEDSAAGSVAVAGSGGSGGPTADAGGPYSVEEGESVELNGTGSTDGTGPSEYRWEIVAGDGTLTGSTDENAVYHAPSDVSSETNVSVELTVTDTQDNADTDTATVSVQDVGAPDAPTVESLTVTLNESDERKFDIGANFSDPIGDGDELENATVEIEKTDKSGNSGPDQRHEFDISGDSAAITFTSGQLPQKNTEYTITVTVYDSVGADSDVKKETKTTGG